MALLLSEVSAAEAAGLLGIGGAIAGVIGALVAGYLKISDSHAGHRRVAEQDTLVGWREVARLQDVRITALEKQTKEQDLCIVKLTKEVEVSRLREAKITFWWQMHNDALRKAGIAIPTFTNDDSDSVEVKE